MKLLRLTLPLIFVLMFMGLTVAEYSNVVNTDQTDNFELGGENHSITLNFVDGGADVTVDGVNSEYVMPLEDSAHGYGLFDGDSFTVNGITIEINNADYDTNASQGQLNFTAYQEEDVKTITEGQEKQFYLNNRTNVLALKYVDGGAAIKLNDEETNLGGELQRGDSFYYGETELEALDYGYRNGDAYLEYRISNSEDRPETPQNTLGRIEASCEVRDATQGNRIDYSIDVPGSSNYRDLSASAKIVEETNEYELMQRSLPTLTEGENSFSDELTVPTPVADGRHEVLLELVNDVGDGERTISCGFIGEEVDNPITGLEIDYESEDTTFEFRTDAESSNVIETIEWDLNGDNQYEEQGREVTKTFESRGEKDISLKVTDRAGNTDTVQRTINVTVERSPSSTSISMDSDSVNKGDIINFDVSIAPEHQEPGYTVIIENPSGNAVWRDQSEEASESYSVETSGWTTGEYDVKIRPEQNIIRSVLDLLTGRNSLATESFEVKKSIEPWKEFCQEQNYNTESISSQINCIRDEITPRWFEGSAAPETEIADSLCEDLLSYSYSETQNRCVNQ